MKLALEHIQQTIAATERALSDARNGASSTQRQLDEHVAVVSRNETLLADLRAALAALRTTPVEIPGAVIGQLKKTELGDRQPRAAMTRKGN